MEYGNLPLLCLFCLSLGNARGSGSRFPKGYDTERMSRYIRQRLRLKEMQEKDCGKKQRLLFHLFLSTVPTD